MNSKTTLKVGLIGAGRIGSVHAQSIMTRVAGATITHVADVAVDAARALADEYGVATVTANYHDILQDPDVSAVAICSSTDTHARIIGEAARAGKHIFCEKPIDHDLQRIDNALAAVDEAGVKLFIGFNRRFDPGFAKARDMVKNGKIGTPQILRITSRDPAPPPVEYIKVSGGLFLDMTIHDFDMARFLTSADVEEVFAAGAVMVDPAIGAAGDIDTAVITLKMTNGVLVTIDNSRRAVYGYDQRVECFGSAGMVAIENVRPNTHIYAHAEGVQQEKPVYFFLERYLDAYVAEMVAFVDCIKNDKPSPVNGSDGRAPVCIGLAALRSLRENRPVRLSEIDS